MAGQNITRRRFVGATLATGAAAALPESAEAARQVVSAGHSAIVLEARNGVGGRAWNEQLPGGEVSERGATFVGPTSSPSPRR